MRWAPKVRGVTMFGDEQQLPPVNLATDRHNEYIDRGDLTLETRLLNQNFPHVMLVEQNRSAEALTVFPSARYYDGKLCTSERMRNITLDEQYPGLKKALMEIFQYASNDDIDEAALRRFWIELPGERRTNPFTQYKVVLKVAVWWFDHVHPSLHRTFKKHMFEHVFMNPNSRGGPTRAWVHILENV